MCEAISQRAEEATDRSFLSLCPNSGQETASPARLSKFHVAKAMICMESEIPPGFVFCPLLESLTVAGESGWAQIGFVALRARFLLSPAHVTDAPNSSPGLFVSTHTGPLHSDRLS